MKPPPAYSFPLWHRIGHAARALMASRDWIVVVLILAVVLYLPFLFSGFFQDDHGHRLEFSPDAYEEAEPAGGGHAEWPPEPLRLLVGLVEAIRAAAGEGLCPVVGLRVDQDQLPPAPLFADARL